MKRSAYALSRAFLYFLLFASLPALTQAVASVLLSLFDGGVPFDLFDPRLRAYTVPITLLTDLSLLLLFALPFWRRHEPLTQAFSLRRLSPRRVAGALLLGASASLAAALLLALIPFPAAWREGYEAASRPLTEGRGVLPWLLALVAAPLCEEVAFRALIAAELARGMPRSLALLVSSLLFAVLHGGILWGIFTFFAGCLFAALFFGGSLTASLAAHIGFNAVGMLLPRLFHPLSPLALGGAACAALLLALALFCRPRRKSKVS